MLLEIDTAAATLGATRSELFRAAMRQYLRQLAAEEQLLSRVRAVPRAANEEALGRQAMAARRARRARATG